MIANSKRNRRVLIIYDNDTRDIVKASQLLIPTDCIRRLFKTGSATYLFNQYTLLNNAKA